MGKKLDESFLKALAAAKQEKLEVKQENIRRYGSEKAAKKISPIYRAHPEKSTIKLALVPGKIGEQWFSVHKIYRDPSSWKKIPFFFGIGQGYDISRILVFADSLEDAYTAGEEKYPHLFFTKVISNRQYAKLEENPDDSWEGNPEHYHFIESKNKWGLPDEDIRIAKKAERYVPTAVKIDSRTAIIPDGSKVDYA